MFRSLKVFAWAATIGMGVSATANATDTVVNVDLQDSSTATNISGMQIGIAPRSVTKGAIKFHVVNKSRSVVHEMIVVPVKDESAALPYDQKSGRLIEKKIHGLGEVPELKPGKSGNLRLTLKPGTYLLLCNQPGHYQAGMKATLTVTP